jgi:hypothetical protein
MTICPDFSNIHRIGYSLSLILPIIIDAGHNLGALENSNRKRSLLSYPA